MCLRCGRAIECAWHGPGPRTARRPTAHPDRRATTGERHAKDLSARDRPDHGGDERKHRKQIEPGAEQAVQDTLSKSETVIVAAIEAGGSQLVEAREIDARLHATLRMKAEKELDPWVDCAKG